MSLTIGQQLKNARLDHNLSLEDVFKSTRIRIKYLEALEADDFSVMPSPTQGRGFLRLYAQHLDLDIDMLLAEMRQAEAVEASFAKVDEASVEDEEIVEEEADDAPALPEEKLSKPIWAQLLNRIGVTLASPEPAPVQEAESAPIVEASPISASEAEVEPEPATEVDEGILLEPSEPLEESRIAFAKIGATLRERRELLSLTYEEIEGHIHLRPHYLAALEVGKFDTLPSPVQTRGMLSNYADFLDLDADALLLRFAEGLQAQRIERHVEVAAQFESRVKKRRNKFSLGGFVAPDLIFGVTVVVLIVAFSAWGLSKIAKTRAETDAIAAATAPSIADILMTTPTLEVEEIVTPTLVVVNTPGGEVGTPLPLDENIPEGADLGVQILVTILERSWLRVSVDGELAFEGRAQPNATFVYEGNESVEILTANGAGVRIAYNQRDLGLMGGFGEIVQRIYGARGILTLTVTPTSLATETPTPTITPSPTLPPTATALE
ncbi:MAG: DUF4115 domain-containing protein [Anaerolineae bacterium]|jgi:cytoskeleton protein RodZ|nr:DUF4115 domain-containing protein [Anaerolineae bacterium]MBT7071233.1 DUF4115 domain-containing protein [Anaerolineae bacterium]MBT7324184.1 DUF4115 domain-containing protein [Anaerolineae bacterium]